VNHILRHRIAIAGACLLLSTILWASGCNTTTTPGEPSMVPPSSTTPDQKVLPTGASGSEPSQFVKYLVAKNPAYLTVREAVISASKGGKVTAGQFTVVIPAGALSKDTKITMYASSLVEQIVAIEPTGLQFREGKPATLIYDSRDTDGVGAPALWSDWFNPSSFTWEPMAGGANDGKKFKYSVPLEHFSYYALSRKSQK
jgi:hypothetical protein